MRETSPEFSVIIPCLDEAAHLRRAIASARQGEECQVIVADGGSADGSVDLARSLGTLVIACPKGRAVQMNMGAAAAEAPILVFLHADTLLPPSWREEVRLALSDPGCALAAFRLELEEGPPGTGVIASMANLRARFLGLPFGDQVLCIRRDIFERIGGFPSEPLLEDLMLVQRAKEYGKVRIMEGRAVSSARRWSSLGLFRATAINQVILLGYLLGVSPARLSSLYRR